MLELIELDVIVKISQTIQKRVLMKRVISALPHGFRVFIL